MVLTGSCSLCKSAGQQHKHCVSHWQPLIRVPLSNLCMRGTKCREVGKFRVASLLSANCAGAYLPPRRFSVRVSTTDTMLAKDVHLFDEPVSKQVCRMRELVVTLATDAWAVQPCFRCYQICCCVYGSTSKQVCRVHELVIMFQARFIASELGTVHTFEN